MTDTASHSLPKRVIKTRHCAHPRPISSLVYHAVRSLDETVVHLKAYTFGQSGSGGGLVCSCAFCESLNQ